MLWWASPCEAIHDKHFFSETQWGLSNFAWGYHHWITLLYLFLRPLPYFKAIGALERSNCKIICVCLIYPLFSRLFTQHTHTRIHRIEMLWFVLVFQAPRGLCRRGLHSVPQIKCFRVCAEWQFHGATGCLQHGKLFHIFICLKLLQTHLCFSTEFVVNVEKKLMLSGHPTFGPSIMKHCQLYFLVMWLFRKTLLRNSSDTILWVLFPWQFDRLFNSVWQTLCVCVCVYLHNMWVHFYCYLILLCVMGGGGGGAAKTVLLLITPMNAVHNCMGHLFHNNCILFQSLQCWCW